MRTLLGLQRLTLTCGIGRTSAHHSTVAHPSGSVDQVAQAPSDIEVEHSIAEGSHTATAETPKRIHPLVRDLYKRCVPFATPKTLAPLCPFDHF